VIQGDGANDAISISDNGQGGVTASITLAGGTRTRTATGITQIEINAGGGKDTIGYALTGALRQQESLGVHPNGGSTQTVLDYSAGLSNARLAVTLDGGPGSNQVTAQFGAITGSRVNLREYLGRAGGTSHVNFAGPLSSSLATVHVHGAAGNDQVFSQVGDVSSSNIQFFADLGRGANSFDLEETGNLLNAVVHFDVAGGGANAFTFNARGVNLDTTSRLNLQAWSGAGNDSVTVNYSGQMNGELDVTPHGGRGSDTMNVTLTLGQGSIGRLRGVVRGDRGDDTMSFSVYDNSNPGGPSTLDLLYAVLDGGLGHDTLTATPNVKVIN
jgi:hypothetical protein